MSQDRRLQELQTLFADIDAASMHFANARREFVMGLREVLFAVERAAQPGTVLSGYIGLVQPLLASGRVALDAWLVKLGDAPTQTLPLEVIQALQAARELLAARLMRLDPMQAVDERRGLVAALGLIDQEIERHELAGSSTVASAGEQRQQGNAVQWIEVKE